MLLNLFGLFLYSLGYLFHDDLFDLLLELLHQSTLTMDGFCHLLLDRFEHLSNDLLRHLFELKSGTIRVRVATLGSFGKWMVRCDKPGPQSRGSAHAAASESTRPCRAYLGENRAGQRIERRITGQRIWKVAKAVGARVGLGGLHPHSLRHACGAELLRRTKNLRVVQEQLRHVDIQTTTGYTRLTQQDVRKALETLGDEGE